MIATSFPTRFPIVLILCTGNSCGSQMAEGILRQADDDLFLQQDVETVITVCGNADQACPMFPGQLNRHHWGFDDPPHRQGSEEEQMVGFRRVRDQIKSVFEAYVDGRRDEMKKSATEFSPE